MPLPPGSGSPSQSDGPKSPTTRKTAMSPTRTNDANFQGLNMNFGADILKSPTQRSGVASPKPEIKPGIGSGFSMYGRDQLKSPSQRSRGMSPTRSTGGGGGDWRSGDGFGSFGAFGAQPTASDALKSPAQKSAAGLSPHSTDNVNIDIEAPSEATPKGSHISRAPSRQSQRSQSLNQNTYNAPSTVKSPQQPPPQQLPVGITVSVGADGTTTIHVVSFKFRFNSKPHFTRILSLMI